MAARVGWLASSRPFVVVVVAVVACWSLLVVAGRRLPAACCPRARARPLVPAASRRATVCRPLGPLVPLTRAQISAARASRPPAASANLYANANASPCASQPGPRIGAKANTRHRRRSGARRAHGPLIDDSLSMCPPSQTIRWPRLRRLPLINYFGPAAPCCVCVCAPALVELASAVRWLAPIKQSQRLMDRRRPPRTHARTRIDFIYAAGP